MTKVARLFKEEKEQAVEQTEVKMAKETAIAMLENNINIDTIVRCVKVLSPKEVMALKKELDT